jgi:ABC-type proline/glycine betaine transport system ATPase subunit
MKEGFKMTDNIVIINDTKWNFDNKENLNKLSKDLVKEFWNSHDIAWKKETLLKIAGAFRSKTHIARFIQSVNRTSDDMKLNTIMSNLYLCSEDMATFSSSKKKYNDNY